MLKRQFTLQPDANYPLHITAKQYLCPEFESSWGDPNALTFIVLHSTSFHKETWEPTLQCLFDHVLNNSSPAPHDDGVSGALPRFGGVKIRCAWAIECPNHGESAALNDTALQQPPFHRNFGCEKYAEAVHRFMSSKPADFKGQTLIGIGHSLGGVAIAILRTLSPVFHFSAMILVEPMLSPHGMDNVQQLREALVKGAHERRDTWSSREDAFKYLSSRRGAERWDRRVLELYARFGLRTHPTPSNAASSGNQVTLACSREEEATMYLDPTGSPRGLDSLNSFCGRIPVSIIFGDESDYMCVTLVPLGSK
ncbi:hypothetical protein F5I97DRAFT_1806658 [Phlebopus sp. FC_14]|nr:hypothetical protein F5I97DRAFT_1806658 [Phlebopus sp. FC_14]